MATTTNYGWETPDNTDLVRDGAEAIRDLGEAIDNTVYLNSELGGSVTTIATGTFTSVAALNLSNVLDDTYDFYELLITAKRNTTAGQIFAKFREDTTDFSSGYFGSSTTNNNATEANAGAFNANNSAQMRLANFSTTINTNINIKITRNDATSGQLAYTSMDAVNNLTTMGGSRGAGLANFNGISIFPDANTFSGRFVLIGIK